MGKSCCIKGCDVSHPDVEYFKFPRSGSLLAAWVAATGAPGGDVCSAHFTQGDYRDTRGKRRLLGTAVPSVFQKPPSNTENGDITSNPIDDISKDVNSKNDKTDSKKRKGNKSIDESKPEATDTLDKTDGNSTDRTEDTMDNNESVTDNNESVTENDDTADAKIENGESSQDETSQDEKSEENKKVEKADIAQPEINDIEDMITNYQIKQTKTLADRLNPEPLEDLIPAIMESQPALPQVQSTQQSESGSGATRKVDVNQLASHLADKLDNQLSQIMATAPVFIEVSVDKGETRTESPQDCLMLLESVQCDIDPSSLMLPEPDSDSDMEITDCGTKTEDPNPISLLTSSDEDEVIIEEPHIDTVEVSDETDEDDKPLQRLIKIKPKKKAGKKKKNFEYFDPFYCAQCDFRTELHAEFKQHNSEKHRHSTTFQVCSTCNYSTASKAQFSRHKRKHRDERNFRCHLCNYKARHNMSLIYHLKCHDSAGKKQEKFTCDKCGFSSNVKSEALKHLKGCEGGRYSCDQCSYNTKRRSDLRRHRLRRHSVDDSDEDFTL